MKRLLGIAVLACGATAMLLAQGNNVSVYTIKDVAGILPPTTAATANALFLQVPDAIAVDKQGNVYITDTGGHRVWKVDSNKKVTLVIGNGQSGSPSAGKAADTQQINQPSGLAIDGEGNLYISDKNTSRIWKIDTSGVITLFAGITTNGRFDGDGRPALQADFNSPRGMAFNPVDGNLYVVDGGNQRIRKIDLKSGIVTTVAGSTGSGSATNTAFAGDGGLATRARLNSPEGVAFDAYGDMFISDTGNRRIRMVSNGIITTVAGRDLTNREQGKDDNGNPIKNPITGSNYSAATAPFANSCTFTSPGNSSTTRGGLVLPTTSTTGNTVCAIVGDGKDPLAALLDQPSQIVVDGSNNVIFTDAGNARIRMLVANPAQAGNTSFTGFSGIITIVGTGSNGNGGDGGNGKFATVSNRTTGTSGIPNGTGVMGLALDQNGVLYFTDRGNNRARSFDTVSGLVGAFAGSAPPLFVNPTGIAVDGAGNAYVSDSGNNLIRKIDTSGNVTIIAGVKGGGNASGEAVDPLTAALNNPTGIWVDPSGTLIYFADVGSNRIRRISGGTITTVAGCIFTTAAGASALAQNCNFSSDGLPATVTKINLSGGTTQFTKRFTGVAVDPNNGTIYFSQSGDQVLRKIQNDGTLVTIAGQFGTSGNGGEGGLAVNMIMSSPTGIAVDNAGNILFAEGANFTAHIISGGIVYPLAGQPGINSNDNETSNNVSGVAVPAWGKRYRVIQGVTVDNKGNVYLADTSNNKVDRIPYAAPAACVPATGKTCPANSSQFVDYRVAGNESNTAGDFIFNYTAPASAAAVASTVQLSFPSGVAVDSNGDVFFTDCANNLVREAVAPAPAK